VDDRFALVENGLLRVLKISMIGAASPHHMSYQSQTTQMEHFHEFFWNGLVSLNQNTKQNFLVFLVTKDTESL
jgi:hypothetical protein